MTNENNNTPNNDDPAYGKASSLSAVEESLTKAMKQAMRKIIRQKLRSKMENVEAYGDSRYREGMYRAAKIVSEGTGLTHTAIHDAIVKEAVQLK